MSDSVKYVNLLDSVIIIIMLLLCFIIYLLILLLSLFVCLFVYVSVSALAWLWRCAGWVAWKRAVRMWRLFGCIWAVFDCIGLSLIVVRPLICLHVCPPVCPAVSGSTAALFRRSSIVPTALLLALSFLAYGKQTGGKAGGWKEMAVLLQSLTRPSTHGALSCCLPMPATANTHSLPCCLFLSAADTRAFLGDLRRPRRRPEWQQP